MNKPKDQSEAMIQIANRRHHLRPGLVVLLLVGAITVLGLHLHQAGVGRSDTRTGRAADRVAGPNGSVNGDFLSISGTTATLTQVRGGQPAMVWFVAGGCASCAASIPAMAENITQLTGDGLMVITLGLYGDFPPGRGGATQVGEFAQAAAPGSLSRPGWIWGLASKDLSETYDPTGTPDVYLLIGPSGHVRYRGSVPVSSMPQLLAQAYRLRELAQPASTSAVPCC